MSVSGTELGRDLIEKWDQVNTLVVEWILSLAEFDRDALWAIDGFTNCVSWLEIKCNMARSTAKEKVRVAHELARRPILRAAFADGRLPYSKARVLTRLDGLDDRRDEKFVAAAADSSMQALETRVRNWNHFNGAEREPNLDDHYGMRFVQGFMDGYGQLILEGPNDMLLRVLGITDAYEHFLFHNGPKQLRLDAVEAPLEPYPQGQEPKRPLAARRLDLFLDLCEEIALVNADKIDPEIAAIGVTVQYENLIANQRSLVPTDHGAIITGEAARRLACDAGVCRMVIKGVSEFLDVGRKTRTWTTAQRRAIRARHNHRCAAAGCNRRITQIHHIEWWDDDGETRIDNGVHR